MEKNESVHSTKNRRSRKPKGNDPRMSRAEETIKAQYLLWARERNELEKKFKYELEAVDDMHCEYTNNMLDVMHEMADKIFDNRSVSMSERALFCAYGGSTLSTLLLVIAFDMSGMNIFITFLSMLILFGALALTAIELFKSRLELARMDMIEAIESSYVEPGEFHDKVVEDEESEEQV